MVRYRNEGVKKERLIACIEAFSEKLRAKGYKGNFEISNVQEVPLPEVLHHYVERCELKNIKIFPAYLSTFLKGTAGSREAIISAFIIDWNERQGLYPWWMRMERMKDNCVLCIRDLHIKQWEDIPEKREAIKMVVNAFTNKKKHGRKI